MSAPRIGELFAGYGGLGMGVQQAIGGGVVWVSEFDKGANKILEHRFPGVPNHGDITKIDWSQVEPVDILTGGSPCQDLSHAGKRAGMTEGTRSNLWVAMREAIAQLRPPMVVWENVRGAYSAAADSEVEPCAGCVGDGPGVHLRALGRVLGDLADLGYDAIWHGLRAAHIGAPHGRFRVFVIASPADTTWPRLTSGGSRSGQAPDGEIRDRHAEHGSLLPTPVADNSRGLPSSGTDYASLPNAVVALLPTPMAAEGIKAVTSQTAEHRVAGGHHVWLTNVVQSLSLLPTPAVNDMGAAYTPDEWDAWPDRMKAEHGNGNGHGKSLHIEAARLLPTPRAEERQQHNSRDDYVALSAVTRWGQYAAAIARWEALTRPAPPPTETGPKGNPRLSAAFSEWMMGLPAGWVTDVPGITRNEALKALGNGVVPQQAAAALRWMLAQERAA